MRFAETSKSFMIDMWLARQTPEKVLPIIHKVIEAAKAEFADAVAKYVFILLMMDLFSRTFAPTKDSS